MTVLSTPCVIDDELDYCVHTECIEFSEESVYSYEDFDYQDVADYVYDFESR